MYPRDLMNDAIATSGPLETRERFKTCEVARMSFRDAHIVKPPGVPGVEGAIDMHCHAHGRQQDALSVAKHASTNGMGGIVFKTIVSETTPAESVRKVREELHRWCDEQRVAATKVFSAMCVGRGGSPITCKSVKESVDDGCAVVWMPVYAHANTMSRVVTNRPDPENPTGPLKLQACLSWEEATKLGHYTLDQQGRLLPQVRDIIHLAADRGVVISLGHTRREEQLAIVEEMQKIGFKKCFMDHPFSPFTDLSAKEMKQFVAAGVYLNFTYNELSPLLGINPLEMFEAVKAVGAEHVLLSSDAGDPFFPNSVECIRLMRVYGGAFGMMPEEVLQASVHNPAKLLADVH